MAIDWEALPPDLAEMARERFSPHKVFAEKSRAIREDLVIESPKPKDPYRSKLERRFAGHLDTLKPSLIREWWYEPTKFWLAGKTTYRPDFLVWRPQSDRLTFVECKGFMRDDAAVKIKVAAAMYPCFRWLLVRSGKGHLWQVREVTDKGIGTSPVEVEWI